MLYNKFQNGLGISKYDQTGFDDMIVADIHSELGTVSANYTMTPEDGDLVDAVVKCVTIDPDGTTRWFSATSGKIWKRDPSANWSLDHTNSITTGHLGAHYFNGFIYYATAGKLGRLNIATGVWSDTWATFTNANGDSHPMYIQNLSLFIGDGKYIASVDNAGSFSANALDIPANHNAMALISHENDLLIGTRVGASIYCSGLFRWDTYSSSWWDEDYIWEKGINFIFPAKETKFIYAGSQGHIYYVANGAQMKDWKTIRGVSVGNHYNAQCVYQGKSLIAMNGKVYSIHRSSENLPLVDNTEYMCSAGYDANINCMAAVGETLLVAWDKSGTYGVDKISTTTRYNATVTTPIATGEFTKVIVHYELLPAGTSISIETKVDLGDWTDQTEEVDTINKQVYTIGGISANKTNFMQARITLNCSGTSTPIIRAIEII